jgi:PAS domain S-box-containing protein
MINNILINESSNKMISIIYKLSALLTEPAPPEKTLALIMETVKSGLGFERCSILLVDKERMLLNCKYITGFTADQEKTAKSRPLKLNKHDCVETKVALLGRPILVKSLSDSNITEIDRIITANMERGSFLYVPLKVKGEIIGILGVNKKQSEPVITENEIESLSIFANFASVVLENSRLYETLLKEKKFSENILNSSMSGIITTDIQGVITSINPAAESILSVRRKKVINTSLRKILGVKSAIDKIIDYPSVEPRKASSEYECLLKRDGNFVILNIHSSPIIDENDNSIGILHFIKDITSEKEHDKRMQRISGLASLGELAAGVAHEIRNPLTGISIVLDILKSNQNLSRSDKRLLKGATTEIERLEKIIADLLDFARPQEFNYKAENINNVIKSIYNLLYEQCRKQNIELIIIYGCDLPKSVMDKGKIRQGLLNIMINGIKAMPQGGKLRIETLCESDGNDGRRIVIIISDTGIGINDSVKDRIFNPFFTTYSEGTGLGLSITHSIVKEHRGWIKFDSTVGKGTTFKVFLPVILDKGAL